MKPLESLRELARDLFYPSEEDAPLVVVDLGVAASVDDAVHAHYTDSLESDVDAFFAAPSRGGFGSFAENVAGFARLRRALETDFGPLAAFESGFTRLVAGRDREGRVVAIETKVIET